MTSSTAAAKPTGINHLRLTVTDIARSKAFYVQVLGMDPVIDFSHQADEPGIREDRDRFYGGCVFSFGEQVLGLRPVAQPGDTFDSTRVGLDHVSLSVASVDALNAAAKSLDDAGVTHGTVDVLEGAGIAILSIQDPDDINLELVAPVSE
ncbi:VOC family protein [uncultured Jatrophihabitans sp.]|uniref:VOC family protein n=1 Tax=uncultured Jatrophihabitans sp. TaxID=1610747 RepID=UPI0035C9C9CE